VLSILHEMNLRLADCKGLLTLGKESDTRGAPE
jgi:hypothetical protein